MYNYQIGCSDNNSDSSVSGSEDNNSEDDSTTASISAAVKISTITSTTINDEDDHDKLSIGTIKTSSSANKEGQISKIYYRDAPLTVENRHRRRLNAKLLTAIECGNMDSFSRCLHEGAEPNSTCRKTGMTACHLAALLDRDDMIALLLSRCADCLRYNWQNGCLPLHLASLSGSVSCLQKLIHNQPNSINAPTKQSVIDEAVETEILDSTIHCHQFNAPKIPDIPLGSTALHVACRNLKSDCVVYLLNNGADVNVKDERNLAPISVINEDIQLDWQCFENRKPSTDWRSPSDCKKTAVSSSLNAASNNNSITSCVSIDTVVISSTGNSSGETDFNVDGTNYGNRIKTSDDNVFRLDSSLDCFNNSDNEMTDKSYLTAHTKASKYESETIRIILENLIYHGACYETVSDVVRDDQDSTVCFQKNSTLLHTAVAAQDPRLIEQLIRTGFSILDLNEDGDTPLDVAIKRRLPLSLDILIKSAGNLNAIFEYRDADNKTALQAAVCESWIFGVGVLLEAGASVTVKGKNDNTVFHYAAQTGNPVILEELLCFSNVNDILDCRNSMDETALMVAVQRGNAECVRQLLDYGANTRLSVSNNVTIVHVASEKGYVDILESILKVDPDLKDAKTNDGLTALHTASTKGRLSCVRFLLSIGCDEFARTAVTYFGGTPLHFAARNGHLNVVECLTRHNKRLTNAANVDGWYPLHIAAAFGHKECVRSIVQANGDLSKAVIDSAGNRKTAVDLIVYTISDPSEFLHTILDSYIDVNTMPLNHRKCVITFKYDILMPSSFSSPDKPNNNNNNNNKKQMNVLNAFLNNQNVALRRDLFLHPLLQTFLHLKWRKLRMFFFVSVLLYLAFTLSLTVFAFEVYVWKLSPIVKLISGSFMLSTLLLLSLQEILHASKLQRYYITDVESLLKWTAFIVAFVAAICGFSINAVNSSNNRNATTVVTDISIGYDDGKSATTNDTGKCVRCNRCQDITAVAILLSWLELLFILSRFPGWGFYVLMFFHVASRILKVFSTFTCLIIGFVLSFYILFDRTSPFVGIWETFVKVIVMTSELDYSNMFSNVDDNPSTGYVGRLVFLTFVLLVGIVLMNLMIGLAVNDINQLETDGKSRTLAKQIDFLNMLETFVCHKKFVIFLPRTMRKRIKAYHMVPNTFKYYPGRPLSSMSKKLPNKLRNSILHKALQLQNLRKNDNECTGNVTSNDKRKSSSSLKTVRFGDVEEILKNVVDELNIIKHRISNAQ